MVFPAPAGAVWLGRLQELTSVVKFPRIGIVVIMGMPKSFIIKFGASKIT